MCRALAYLGQPVPVDHLLFQPDSSLVKQSFMPRKLRMLNLAGFGIVAWDRHSVDPEVPFTYASTDLPVFDRNLKSLAEKVHATCMLGHVRGVVYSTAAQVSEANIHPFRFPGCSLALAHNGDLYRMAEMKPALVRHVRPEFLPQITGNTDSEWIYALILSQLDDPAAIQPAGAIHHAVEKTFRIIADVRARLGIDISSSVNLFLADGHSVVGVRFCFDFGRYPLRGPDRVHEANLTFVSLWFTSGRAFGFHEGEWMMIGGSDMADSVIVASEPLTADTTSWLEVPEYGLLYATAAGGRPTIEVQALNV